MARFRSPRKMMQEVSAEESEVLGPILAKVLVGFEAYHKMFDRENEFDNYEAARVLGIEQEEGLLPDSRAGCIAWLKERCEAILRRPPRSFPLVERNLDLIARAVGLGEKERAVLRFAVYLHYFGDLVDALNILKPWHVPKVYRMLALVVDAEEAEVRRMFASDAPLVRSGLLPGLFESDGALRDFLTLPHRYFAERIFSYDGEDILELYGDVVRPVSDARLSLEDFDSADASLGVAVRYLKASLRRGEYGVNILLYGRPGSGKTEWVKALAKALDRRLYEISSFGEEKRQLDGYERLSSFRTAQLLLSPESMMLLFDEIEDIFDEADTLHLLSGRRPPQKHKGWLNRVLESTRVPCIWVGNAIHMMDPAVVRRFDIVVPMPLPTRAKRARLARHFFGNGVEERLIDLLAEREEVTPALMERAARVVRRIGGSPREGTKIAHRLLSSTLTAQGHRPLAKPKASEALAFDPVLAGCENDLAAIAEGIVRHGRARLCLYGPPGTGKSAFGRWLAERLDRPCLVKKGSDLLSMWVGGTEANIAAAFEEAERENAVLVFDEIDSFLQDRREAQRSWEVTQVNELLTQMEAFEGVFVATTNLMENLDPASLRRFDLKLKFGYLHPAQAEALLRRWCERTGLEVTPKALCRVQRLSTLTPGDFAAVARRHRFDPLPSCDAWVERLEEECAIKKVSVRTIGFQGDAA